MKFLLLVVAWATAVFIAIWPIAHPYQHALAAVAGKLAAPPGSSIEFEQLELFFPFDVGIYVALCLASVWAVWPRRFRALALGVPVLIALEVIALVWAMKVLMGVMSHPNASDAAVDQAMRISNAVIRVSGLITASVLWFYVLGRERLSLAARTWLDAASSPAGRREA
jgi:hypothetical protein